MVTADTQTNNKTIIGILNLLEKPMKDSYWHVAVYILVSYMIHASTSLLVCSILHACVMQLKNFLKNWAMTISCILWYVWLWLVLLESPFPAL